VYTWHGQGNPWHLGETYNETARVSDSYPCPCCGHRVLDAMPGSYEICPVCFWEDDGVQFRWPTMAGGANKVSLIKAQGNYQHFGACPAETGHVAPVCAGTARSYDRW